MIYKNATNAFESLYKKVADFGEDFAGTKALFNCSFSLSDPSDKIITTPIRKFNVDYANFEFDWYMTGNRDAKEISERAKIWKNMMIPGTTNVVSNYGSFWNYNNQLNRVITDLKQNPDTRRAIIVHYLLHELDIYKYDTPCNVVLNFYIKNNLLNLTVFARSIDLWYGFGNDQYCFAKLMELISEKTGHSIGQMHFFITNLHLYPKHYSLLEK
jgi:thymidylate synthase